MGLVAREIIYWCIRFFSRSCKPRRSSCSEFWLFYYGGFGGFRFFGFGIPYSGKIKLKTLKIIIILKKK